MSELGYKKQLEIFKATLGSWVTETNNSLSPFASGTDTISKDSSNDKDDTETVTVQLQGYLKVKECIDLLTQCEQTIFDTIDKTYNEYINGMKIDSSMYLALFAFSNSAKDTVEYINSTETYEVRPEYSETINNIFELQENLNLTSWLEQLERSESPIKNTVALIEKYQSYFEQIKDSLEKDTAKEDTSTDTTTYYSLGYIFWGEKRTDKNGYEYSIEEFSRLVDIYFKPFSQLVNGDLSFAILKQLTLSHKALYTDAMNATGFMNSLIATTENEKIPLTAKLHSIGLQGGFTAYSSRLGAFFNKLQDCKSILNNTKTLEKTTKSLKNIANSEVLKAIGFESGKALNFFTQSKNNLEWVKRFRARWRI